MRKQKKKSVMAWRKPVKMTAQRKTALARAPLKKTTKKMLLLSFLKVTTLWMRSIGRNRS